MLECTSLRCEAPVALSSVDRSIAAAFFRPSASVGCFDLTSLAQAVFAYTPIMQQHQQNDDDDALVCSVNLTPGMTWTMKCSSIVPPDGRLITPDTQVLLVDSMSELPTVADELDRLRGKCPWVSDQSLTAIASHLQVCFAPTESSSAIPRGLLITGPPTTGKKSLARAFSDSVIDCRQLSELSLLHEDDFSPQVVMKNIFAKWTPSSPLVFLNLDAWRDQSEPPSPTASSSSSLPERFRRIFLLELINGFRNAHQRGLVWISTASSSLSAASCLARWIACRVPLDTLEFSQRMRLFEAHEGDASKLRRVVLRTHGWTAGRCYRETASLGSDEDAPVPTSASAPTSLTRVFGMDDDLQIIRDACVTPLCRVARELREGLRSFSSPAESASSSGTHIALPKGVLVVGPTGCGKSFVLKHLADEIARGSSGGVAVVLQDTLALVQKEVGATEVNIHNLFERARAAAPCVLLLDHIDTIAAPRSRLAMAADSSAQVADRMLSTLLIEMDGVAKSERDRFVLVVATAPSLEALDPAIRRPGRLDIHIDVKKPDVEAVSQMLRHLLKMPGGGGEEEDDADAVEIFRNRAGQFVARGSSYADVQSWCQRKMTALVSTWLRLRSCGDEDSAIMSFASRGEWLAWLSGDG